MDILFSVKDKTAFITISSGGSGFIFAREKALCGAEAILNGTNPEKLYAAH